MAVEQYKLQYLVDWELIIPIQLNPVEKKVVSAFLDRTVEYTSFGAFSVSKVPNCSIVRTFNKMIITKYKQIAEICSL